MRFVAEPISQHRLSRFHRWAMLWLAWFAAFLDATADLAPLSKQAAAIGHHWLDRIERVVIAIVLLRASPHVRGVNRRKGIAGHTRIDSAVRRAIIGSALRRALHARDLRERIQRLTQDISKLVARLLKRLRRGLTRRRPIRRVLNRASSFGKAGSLRSRAPPIPLELRHFSRFIQRRWLGLRPRFGVAGRRCMTAKPSS
jgi:hypothetical protein